MTTYTTYQQVGIREQLSDHIYSISPTETPFFTMCTKGEAAKARFIDWQTDSLASTRTHTVIEGADATYRTRSPTRRLRNHTQNFEDAFVISDVANVVTTAGRKKEAALQLEKAAKQVKRDIEATLTGNTASYEGSALTARRMGTLESWYRTNATRGTGGSSGGFTTSTNRTVAATDVATSVTNRLTFTEARLKTAVRNIWSNGGQPTVVMVGPVNKQKASAFVGIAGLTRETNEKEPSSVTILGAADMYRSDFGKLKIVPNRFSRERTAHILDMDYWSLHTLLPFEVIELARVGQSERRMLRTELTLCSKQEAASGVISDLIIT